MKLAHSVTFASSGLDRAEDLRRDPEILSAYRSTGDLILFWQGKPLLAEDLSLCRIAPDVALPEGATEVFLGREGDRCVFAADVSGWEVEGAEAEGLGAFVDRSAQTHPLVPKGASFQELRVTMNALSARDAELCAMGKATIEWHNAHRFCGACGAATELRKAGFQRSCIGCGKAHFPRTDPVVIMLITHGDDVLVGRSHGWPEGMYSLLAGFIDPGETIEAAVRREVWEEAGVRVGDVEYLASQPWPFPASLMIGCSGQALEREITIDPDEIEDATWVSRQDMMEAMAGRNSELLPARKGAIARFLIEKWLEDRLD